MISVPSTVREMQEKLGDKIVDAYALADQIHTGQKRKSGEPYIRHPLAVAELLFSVGLDKDVICAAFLHDTLEDGDDPNRIEQLINELFGDHVAYLVHAVSKDGRITDKLEQQAAYIKQITNAFEVDVFAFFIKIADLIHNMKTIIFVEQTNKDVWVKELKYQYLPVFSGLCPRIPMEWQQTYHQLLDAMRDVLDVHDRENISFHSFQ
jgi:GTP pyrophosphokinase